MLKINQITCILSLISSTFLTGSAFANEQNAFRMPLSNIIIINTQTSPPIDKPHTPDTPATLNLQATNRFEFEVNKAIEGIDLINFAYITGNNSLNVSDINWGISDGNLPTGLSLIGSSIVGTPTVEDVFTFDVTAIHPEINSTAIQGYTILINGKPTHITDFSADTNNTCAITVSRSVYCWGSNYSQQLGFTSSVTTPYSKTPVLSPLTNAEKVASSSGAICIITHSKTVQCVGERIAANSRSSTTYNVSNLTNVSDLSGGSSVMCAISPANNNTVKCWGSGKYNVGNPTVTTATSTPVIVTGTIGATQVSAGFDHACAVINNGSVSCWGNNTYGQLGLGTTSEGAHASQVPGISDAIHVSAGNQHTCVLHSTGKISCWGRNNQKQVNPSADNVISSPLEYPNISGVNSVSASYDSTCVTLGSNGAKCWGSKANGALGDNKAPSSVYSATPIQVENIRGNATKVSGHSHNCVLSTTQLYCFGMNNLGQIGNNSTTDTGRPTIINVPE